MQCAGNMRHSTYFLNASIFVFICWIMQAATLVNASDYQIKNLGSFRPFAINNHEVVAGNIWSKKVEYAAVWRLGKLTKLHGPFGSDLDTEGLLLNERGEVAGTSIAPNYSSFPTVWTLNGLNRHLSTRGYVHAFDDAGHAYVSTPNGAYAWAWQSGTPKRLIKTMAEVTCAGSGVIAGIQGSNLPLSGKIVIDDKECKNWAISGREGRVVHINKLGFLCGFLTLPRDIKAEDDPRALGFICRGDKLKIIKIKGAYWSVVLAVNAHGDAIVGSGSSHRRAPFEEHDFLYHAGKCEMLDAMFSGSGWTNCSAKDINDSGTIVGVGEYHHQQAGFIATLKRSKAAKPDIKRMQTAP